jgi:hypothetical protein
MAAGRPTKYDPAMCEMVIAIGEEGKTLAGMADALDVDRETINNWRAAHPEFSRAIKRGLEKAQAWWEEQGRVATFGATDGFNATSYIFQMKNRFREEWNDTIKAEHTGKNGGPIETADRGAEKLAAYLDAISSRAAGQSAE